MKNAMRWVGLAVVIMAILTGAAEKSDAGTIFDNYKGTNAPVYVEETRPATETFGTVVNSTANTTINRMEFRWRPNNDMDVTFYIFESDLDGTFGSVNYSSNTNTLLFSQTKQFSAVVGPVDYWLVTDDFNFTFQAGRRYDIGILGSSGSLTGSWDIANGSGNINTVQGGFESINRNANLGISPPRSNLGYAGVDPHIRLITNNVAAVPEPSTVASLGLASLIGLAARFRRRLLVLG